MKPAAVLTSTVLAAALLAVAPPLLGQRSGGEAERKSLHAIVRMLRGQEDYYLLSLAVVALTHSRIDDGRRLVDQALEINADNAEAWVMRGDFLEIEERDAEAFAAYDRAIGLGTWWPRVLARRGWARSNMGDIAGGIVDLETYLADAPDDAAALNNLAWMRIQSGEFVKALTTADRAVSLLPATYTYDTRGWARYHAGRRDDALADARQAVKLDPLAASSQVLLYRIATDRGDGVQALADLGFFLASVPAAELADPWLQVVYYLLGEVPIADLRKLHDWLDIEVLLRGLPGIE